MEQNLNFGKPNFIIILILLLTFKHIRGTEQIRMLGLFIVCGCYGSLIVAPRHQITYLNTINVQHSTYGMELGEIMCQGGVFQYFVFFNVI